MRGFGGLGFKVRGVGLRVQALRVWGFSAHARRWQNYGLGSHRKAIVF